MKQIAIALGILTGSILASCKKDKNESQSGNGLSTLESKVVGKWTLVSSIDSNTGKVPATVTDVTLDCERGDIYNFTTSRSYSIDDGDNKCDNPLSGGNWKVAADSLFQADIIRTLSQSYPKLIFIDGQTMILRVRDYTGPTSGSIYTTNTFTKQ